MIRETRTRRRLALSLSAASILLLLFFARRGRERPAQAATPLLVRAAMPTDLHALFRKQLDWHKLEADPGGYAERLPDGRVAELTLDPRLQHLAEHVLGEHPAEYATAVMLDVEDGRVLALAGRSSAEPEATPADLACRAWAPAASVFKLVTSAALLERGVSPDVQVCYHGGEHALKADNLIPSRRLDDRCHTLSYAVAKSENAIVARLAHDHLDQASLERTARALGFGEALDFDLPVDPSGIALPDDALGFARAAAGFWSTTLSPLHGAYLAATIARGGITPPLHLVDRVVAPNGNSLRPDPPAPERALPEAVASALTQMMVGTTEYGTARFGFRDRRTGRPLLPGIEVAGKTGSLDRKSPYLAYSWFVGFAPAERPEVAVAVLLGNGLVWHVKAHQVAGALLAGYFKGEPSVRAKPSLAALER